MSDVFGAQHDLLFIIVISRVNEDKQRTSRRDIDQFRYLYATRLFIFVSIDFSSIELNDDSDLFL
jgi:hypothetical protein